MLKFLRQHANSWIMRILLGILILSFGLFWGISEFFRGSDHSNIVARIGKLEISKQQLMRSVETEISKLNKELKGKSVSFSQALSLGLVSQNLNRMINEIVLDMFMKDIKLSVMDKTIASLIYADPLFHNSQGSFDKERFRGILRANGIGEKSFFESRRRALAQMHLLTAITAGQHAPAAMSFPVFQALTQKTSFRVATILPERIKVSYTEKELKEFYDTHTHQFKIPEYRDFKLILLDPRALSAKVSVSEAEIRQAYEEQKDGYVTPEARSFSIVTCNGVQGAREDREKIRSGSLEPSREKKYELVTETSLDPRLGKAVFQLKQGQISDPILWNKQTILIKINKIEPSHTKSLSQVRSQILEDLKYQKALEGISKVTAQIEEGSNQGLSLGEIAAKYKIFMQTGRIDSTGASAQGYPVLSLETDVVKDIFSLSAGSETQLTELADEVSYMVAVTQVVPEHLRPFEKVRAEVVAAVVGEKKRKEALKISDKIKDQMQRGQAIRHEAVTLVDTPKVSIMEGPQALGLPMGVVHRGFSLAKGESDAVFEKDRLYVILPLSIDPVPIDKNLGLYKGYKADLGKSLFQNMYTGFVEALKKEYKVQTYPNVVAHLKD